MADEDASDDASVGSLRRPFSSSLSSSSSSSSSSSFSTSNNNNSNSSNSDTSVQSAIGTNTSTSGGGGEESKLPPQPPPPPRRGLGKRAMTLQIKMEQLTGRRSFFLPSSSSSGSANSAPNTKKGTPKDTTTPVATPTPTTTASSSSVSISISSTATTTTTGPPTPPLSSSSSSSSSRTPAGAGGRTLAIVTNLNTSSGTGSLPSTPRSARGPADDDDDDDDDVRNNRSFFLSPSTPTNAAVAAGAAPVVVEWKGHRFARFAYKCNVDCAICQKTIWGYLAEEHVCKGRTRRQQAFQWEFHREGYRCSECGWDFHKRCVKSLLSSASSSSPSLSSSSPSPLFSLPECQGSLHNAKEEEDPISEFFSRVTDKSLIQATNGFAIEKGIAEDANVFDFLAHIPLVGSMIENSATETGWYDRHFHGKSHDIYIPELKGSEEPFLVSVLRESSVLASSPDLYRVIHWLKTGKNQWTIPVDPDEFLNVDQILSIVQYSRENAYPAMQRLDSGEALFADLCKELSIIEDELCPSQYKIGVLYCKPGQTNEDDMFGNKDGSPIFEEFLNTIGERIDVATWKGYMGGLNEDTGSASYFTTYDNNDIMFHVSTLLPFNPQDTQQLARKRHIGNDIVCIVFCDEKSFVFSPLAVSSRFIHTFIVICYEGRDELSASPKYRINVVSHQSVPNFGPVLPEPPVFTNLKEFKRFLMAKIINAEKAAYRTPQFQFRRERTLSSLLHHIHSRFFSEAMKKGKSKKEIKAREIEPLHRAPPLAKPSSPTRIPNLKRTMSSFRAKKLSPRTESPIPPSVADGLFDSEGNGGERTSAEFSRADRVAPVNTRIGSIISEERLGKETTSSKTEEALSDIEYVKLSEDSTSSVDQYSDPPPSSQQQQHNQRSPTAATARPQTPKEKPPNRPKKLHRRHQSLDLGSNNSLKDTGT